MRSQAAHRYLTGLGRLYQGGSTNGGSLLAASDSDRPQHLARLIRSACAAHPCTAAPWRSFGASASRPQDDGHGQGHDCAGADCPGVRNGTPGAVGQQDANKQQQQGADIPTGPAVAAATAAAAATMPPEAAEAAAAAAGMMAQASGAAGPDSSSGQQVPLPHAAGHAAAPVRPRPRESHGGFEAGAGSAAQQPEPAFGSEERLPSGMVEQHLSIDRSGLITPKPHAHGASPAHKQLENDMTRHLKALIRFRGGPLTVAEFMSEALTNPISGYYIQRDVFGSAGDFITAPEVSQMFGEMVGIWAVTVWQSLGCPSEFRLVELGPGRGTLMADALRGTAPLGDFGNAISVHFVEVSNALRQRQWTALQCSEGGLRDAGPVEAGFAPEGGVSGLTGSQVRWHRSLEEVPAEGPPTLYIANEFFDALPIHQLQRGVTGSWTERLVDIAGDEDSRQLRFVLAPKNSPATPAARLLNPEEAAATAGADAPSVEVSPQSAAIAADLAKRIAASGGAALIIDYGSDAAAMDSLRGIKDHAFVHPLDNPGEADLSADVDFGALRRAAEGSGADVAVHGPVPQADFLAALGIGVRLDMLLQNAKDPGLTQSLQSGYRRLMGTDDSSAADNQAGSGGGSSRSKHSASQGGMGYSYKAMAITAAGMPPPVGFEDAARLRAAASDVAGTAAAAAGASGVAAAADGPIFGGSACADGSNATAAAEDEIPAPHRDAALFEGEQSTEEHYGADSDSDNVFGGNVASSSSSDSNDESSVEHTSSGSSSDEDVGPPLK